MNQKIEFNKLDYVQIDECNLLGCTIMSNKCFEEASNNGIKTSDFVNPLHQKIWNALLSLKKNDVEISLMSTISELAKTKSITKKSELNYILEISNSFVTSSTVSPYILAVKQNSYRRELTQHEKDILLRLNKNQENISDIILDSEKQIMQLSEKVNSIKNKNSDSITNYLENKFGDDLKSFAAINTRTGFSYLDYILNGKIYPGMYVLGAISSLGKTTWLAQVADQIAACDIPVLYFSIEQSQMEIVCKSLSRHISEHHLDHRVSSIKIRNWWHPGMDIKDRSTPLNSEEIQYINESYEWYKRIIAPNMQVCGSNFACTIETIKSKIKQVVSSSKVKPVIFVDYLQIIQPEKDFKGTEKQQLDYVMTELTRLSKQLQITIFSISSINRVSYTQPVSFESFKSSGSIEYSADVVLTMDLNAINTLKETSDKIEARNLLDQEKSAIPRKIQMKILKNRYGRTGECTYFKYYPDGDYFENVQMLETEEKENTNNYGIH